MNAAAFGRGLVLTTLLFALTGCATKGKAVETNPSSLPRSTTPPVVVALDRTPAFQFAPGTVRLKVQVDPQPDNRWVELVLSSENFYRASLWQVDGDSARTSWLNYRDLPAGSYVAVVALVKAGGETKAASTKFEILSSLQP